MTNWPLVHVVILNWNLKKDTAECINSLLGADYPNMRVVVVDNGSTDGSVDFLRSQFPEIDVIANADNLGFAAGNNTGIQHALRSGADLVLVLNNDTIVDPTSVTELIRPTLGSPKVGIVGPLILYHEAKDRIWELGAREHRWSPIPLSIERGRKDSGYLPSVVPLDYVTGCAMLIKSEVLRAVGPFQACGSLYYWYGGDLEFCRRARGCGYRIVGAPKAKIWHKVAMTAKKTSAPARYLRVRDRVIFFRQCPHGPHPALTALYLLLDSTRTIVADLIRGHTDLIRPLVRGLYDGYRGESTEVRYRA